MAHNSRGEIVNEGFKSTEEAPAEATQGGSNNDMSYWTDQNTFRGTDFVPPDTHQHNEEPTFDSVRSYNKALNPKYDKDTPLEEIQRNFEKEQDEHQKSFASDVNRLVNESDRRIEHQGSLDSNKDANKGFNNLQPLSDTGKDFFARQDSIAEQAKRDAEHQKALESNKEANKGFNNLQPLSDTGKDFFSRQDSVAEQAKRDAEHQKALDSNNEANKGFNNLKPLSDTGKDFFARQDDIGKEARHQDALDSNDKANEGFKPLTPLSNTGRTFFENEDVYKEKEEQRTEIDDLKNNIDALKLQISLLEQRISELTNPIPVVEPTPVQPEPVIEPTPVEPQPLPNPIVVTVPENIDTDRTDIDRERRDRNLRRAGIIASGVAGAVAGGALSLALSTSTPGGTMLGSFALGIAARSANSGLQYFQNRETTLRQQLNSTEDQNERTRVERRLRFATTMRTAMTYVRPFLIGAGIGFAATSLAQIPIGGESLIDRVGDIFNPDASSIDTVASNIPVENTLPETQQVIQTDAPLGGSEVSSVEIPDSVLVENGHVNLEGSAWNGNLAGQPQGHLPGEALNHSNYVGGVHEMAPNLAEQALKQAGVTRQMLMNNLGTNGTHQLLNGFVDAIQMGNPNPSLTEVLNQMNNEGAKNLLSLIGK